MKKQRESTEILDWEELEKAPNTHGSFSFLRPQLVTRQEHRQAATEDTPGSQGVVLADALVDDIASDHANDARKERPYVLRRCTTAQHGHSLGENAIYEALYKAGVPDEDESRRISIGYDRIAVKANLSANAAERGIKALIEKLAVDLIAFEDCATRTGRTYRVHSYSAILKRRRAAGLTHAIRDKGVRLVLCPQQSDAVPGRAETQCRVTVDEEGTVYQTGTVHKMGTVYKTGTDHNPPRSFHLRPSTKHARIPGTKPSGIPSTKHPGIPSTKHPGIPGTKHLPL